MARFISEAATAVHRTQAVAACAGSLKSRATLLLLAPAWALQDASTSARFGHAKQARLNR